MPSCFMCVALLRYKNVAIHPSQWDPNFIIQVARTMWHSLMMYLGDCADSLVVFWKNRPIWKKYAKYASNWIISLKGWQFKKWLKASSRRSFVTFLLPNSPTGPTFFVLDFLKRRFFPKKNTRLNYNPAFLLQFVGMRKRTFQKRKKWATTTVWSDFCLTTTFLVTIKRTSWSWTSTPSNQPVPILKSTLKHFDTALKSSGVLRAMRVSVQNTGLVKLFWILSRYLTNQWDLDLKAKKGRWTRNANFILDASTGPASWGRNSS